MTTTDIVGTRHPRKARQAPTATPVAERRTLWPHAARAPAGVHTGAWRLLERTHPLSSVAVAAHPVASRHAQARRPLPQRP